MIAEKYYIKRNDLIKKYRDYYDTTINDIKDTTPQNIQKEFFADVAKLYEEMGVEKGYVVTGFPIPDDGTDFKGYIE